MKKFGAFIATTIVRFTTLHFPWSEVQVDGTMIGVVSSSSPCGYRAAGVSASMGFTPSPRACVTPCSQKKCSSGTAEPPPPGCLDLPPRPGRPRPAHALRVRPELPVRRAGAQRPLPAARLRLAAVLLAAHARAAGGARATSRVLRRDGALRGARLCGRQMVAPYMGERLTEKEIAKRYDRRRPGRPTCCTRWTRRACAAWAARPTRFGVPRAAANVTCNGAAPRDHAPRARRRPHAHQPGLGVKYWSWARRPIRAGEEIVANYGASFGYDRSFARRRSRCDAVGVPCDALVRRLRSKPGR